MFNIPQILDREHGISMQKSFLLLLLLKFREPLHSGKKKIKNKLDVMVFW